MGAFGSAPKGRVPFTARGRERKSEMGKVGKTRGRLYGALEKGKKSLKRKRVINKCFIPL